MSTRKPGETHLKEVLSKRKAHARKKDPNPYDDAWGWWIEKRLARIESQVKWVIRIALTALAAEVLRIALQTFGITQ